MLQRTSLFRAFAVVLSCLFAVNFSSCETSPRVGGGTDSSYYEGWTERQRAAEVRRLRERAEEILGDFVGSKGEDLEALQEYSTTLGETVKIYPNVTKCPRCYAMYGESLRMLSGYYHNLYRKQEQVASQSSGRREELLEMAHENKKLAEDYARRSLRQFDIYLASGSRHDLKRIYMHAIENAVRLSDYMAALQYLEDLERVLRPPADEVESTKTWIARQRKYLRGQYNRQQEEKLRAELEGNGGN